MPWKPQASKIVLCKQCGQESIAKGIGYGKYCRSCVEASREAVIRWYVIKSIEREEKDMELEYPKMASEERKYDLLPAGVHACKIQRITKKESKSGLYRFWIGSQILDGKLKDRWLWFGVTVVPYYKDAAKKEIDPQAARLQFFLNAIGESSSGKLKLDAFEQWVGKSLRAKVVHREIEYKGVKRTLESVVGFFKINGGASVDLDSEVF